jgi:DNA-directed RNA polymerase specialized sigma24 family protein
MEAAAVTLVRPAELAAQIRTGDREVFVSLYEPDFDGVFDLVLRTVREGKAAAVVLRDALETAWDAFREWGAPYEVSGWLYTLARDAALNRTVRRSPGVRDREALDYTQVDPARLSDPSVGFDKELMEVVWDAAARFGGDDYSLLDLHVRRDLSVGQLADHLDQPRDEIAGRLSRLCDSFNDAVSTTLLVTRARHNCARLDGDLLAGDANVRRTVRRHARECSHCHETKHRFVPATEVLGSFALMTAPPRLREETAKAFLAPDARRRRKGR